MNSRSFRRLGNGLERPPVVEAGLTGLERFGFENVIRSCDQTIDQFRRFVPRCGRQSDPFKEQPEFLEILARTERALSGPMKVYERVRLRHGLHLAKQQGCVVLAGIVIAGLTKRFGPNVVLKPTDLSIADGEFVVIVGPSGCGKSTLLRMIAGLEEQSGGQIVIGGRDVTDAAPADRGVAMVFQSYALYPHMTVAANIGYPLRIARSPKAEIAARVADVAATLDLTELLTRKPAALSGGQRQRVSIARAIIREPQVLLLDEPLSNLDTELRVRMRHEFARLHDRLGATMIYVTHDQLEAMTLANRIVVMSEGRIEQVGSPIDLYDAPANLAVARAIGSPAMNLMPGTIAAVGDGGATIELESGGTLPAAVRAPVDAVGADVTVGVRPEHLVAADEGVFTGAVELFERLGPLSFAHLGARGAVGTVVAQLPGNRRVTLGETLGFTVAPGDVHVFDAVGNTLPRVSP